MTGTIDMTYDEIVERDLESELRCLREELAEWRSGKRRVFWRTRLKNGLVSDYPSREPAQFDRDLYGVPVIRVTVRPK